MTSEAEEEDEDVSFFVSSSNRPKKIKERSHKIFSLGEVRKEARVKKKLVTTCVLACFL